MQSGEIQDYLQQSGGELALMILGILLVVYLVCAAVALAAYIIRSLSLFTIAKRRNIRNYGLAWVPVAYVWTLGSIADGYDESFGIRRKWRVALLTLFLVWIGIYIGYFVFMVVMAMQGVFAQQRFDPADAIQVMGLAWSMILLMTLVIGALNVCSAICYFKLFESCKPVKAMQYLLLMLLVPLGKEIVLLCCRNWDKGQRTPPYPPQPVGIAGSDLPANAVLWTAQAADPPVSQDDGGMTDGESGEV